ncbi:hypothetical protein [Paenibacillus sp. BK033]|uniref:hypothetical protein n=1 Tax=Paenibacillus sp. BK033 TaxID=2512133 RepID=UPI001044BBD6|nr:hypothetical protein [Paenibacillus sp. BK033]
MNIEQVEIKLIVEQINNFIQKNFWFDFSVDSYINDRLTITGGLSLSYPPMIEIYFSEVLFTLVHTTWHTDTSKSVITLLEGEEAKIINRMFGIEVGYQVFRFAPEDCPNELGYLVAAKKITYKIN